MAALILNYLPLLVGVLLLGVIAVVVAICWRSTYEPEDHHLAVIFKNGRFCRFAHPNRKTFLVPFKESVKGQVDLTEQTCMLRLRNLMTQDYRRVSARLFVSYRINLEPVRHNLHLCDMVDRSDAEWRALVERVLENIARNEVFPNRTLRECFHAVGREAIHLELSDRLSQALVNCGVAVNADFGVMLLDLQPG